MAIDSYSLCPGGRGKKIQFCCPEHIKNLQQLDKMFEGEQFAAGLAFVESLEEKHPDCACLTEAKCLFQRMIGLWEDAYETAKKFVEREPNNVVALTEAATTAGLLDKPQEAVERLVAALENVEGDQFPVALVQAMLTVGMAFFENGRLVQAVAIAKQLQAFAPQDPSLNRFLYRCLGSETVPLMIKEQTFDLTAPANFSKKAEYDAAVVNLAHGKWNKGREALEALIPFADEWPNLFRSLGLVEYWFVNEEKGRAYFERFLAADGIDYESKVDLEQFLLLLTKPSWDDVDYMERRVYTIDDFDSACEKLLSSQRLVANPQIAAPIKDDVPPKNAFLILNRPLCDKTIDLALDDVAQQVGYLFLYGRQTTRAARAEVYATPEDFAIVETTISDALGALPPLESQEKLEQQPFTWTTNVSAPRFQFRDPSKLTTEVLEKLFDDALHDFAERWFDHKYVSLGGISPSEAIASPEGKRKVDALLRLVVGIFEASYGERLEKRLRELTGIPAPEPIVPPENFESQEDSIEYFQRLPLWRWGRLQVDKCSTETLVRLLQVANLVAPRAVKEKFALELTSRPKGEVQYEDLAVAYSVLVDKAILGRDSDRALEIISEAAAYARNIGQSDGHWKVLEIMTRFRRQEFDKVRTLARQVFTDYQDDKQAIQMLQEFLSQVNATVQAQLQAAEVARLRAGQPPSQPAAPTRSSLDETRLNFGITDLPPQHDQQAKGLWTPNGGSEDSASNGSSKLWIPD